MKLSRSYTKYDVILENTYVKSNFHYLGLDSQTISFYFHSIAYAFNPERSAKLYPLFQLDADYTFRNYGKLKYFDILPGVSFKMLIPKSYLDTLRHSRVIPLSEIEKRIDNIYGLNIRITDKELNIRELNIIHVSRLTYAIIPGRSLDDLQSLLDMLGEQKVIGLWVIIRRYKGFLADFLLLVDDNTRTLLNKLIYIYTHISDFLEKHNITLKDILEDVDLYVSIAAATET
jgi:hypothetical protein